MNKRRTFRASSQFGYHGRSNINIIPEGHKADGWFKVTMLLKETLDLGSNFVSAKSKEADTSATYPMSSLASCKNVVLGDTVGFTLAVEGSGVVGVTGLGMCQHARVWLIRRRGRPQKGSIFKFLGVKMKIVVVGRVHL